MNIKSTTPYFVRTKTWVSDPFDAATCDFIPAIASPCFSALALKSKYPFPENSQ